MTLSRFKTTFTSFLFRNVSIEFNFVLSFSVLNSHVGNEVKMALSGCMYGSIKEWMKLKPQFFPRFYQVNGWSRDDLSPLQLQVALWQAQPRHLHQSIPPVVKLSTLWRSDKKVPATRSAPPANGQARAGGDFCCCNASLPPILCHCFDQPVHPADVLLRVILVVKGTQLWMARMKAIATRVVWPPLSCSMSLRGSASPANVTRGGKFSGRLQLLLFWLGLTVTSQEGFTCRRWHSCDRAGGRCTRSAQPSGGPAWRVCPAPPPSLPQVHLAASRNSPPPWRSWQTVRLDQLCRNSAQIISIVVPVWSSLSST